jgi:hypothetical protein
MKQLRHIIDPRRLWEVGIQTRSKSTVATSSEDITQLSSKIKQIATLENLVMAYEAIKSKPGNLTRGVTSETLDGINLR